MHILITILLSVTGLANPNPAKHPFASSSCKFKDKAFEVKLESAFAPNDPGNDSEGAQFISINGKEAEKRGGKHMADGAFTFLEPEEGSLCDKTKAYAVGDKFVAVLYQEDNRPFQNLLHAAFYDPAANKIVKVERKLGAINEVIATKDGFAFSNAVERSDADSIERQSPWGKTLWGSDKDLGALQRVRLEKGKIKIAFDPDLSFEHSLWKDFYQKKEDYLADAGWNPKTRKFRNVVVYDLTHFNRKESSEEQKCIGMTHKTQAGVAENKWRCRKVQH